MSRLILDKLPVFSSPETKHHNTNTSWNQNLFSFLSCCGMLSPSAKNLAALSDGDLWPQRLILLDFTTNPGLSAAHFSGLINFHVTQRRYAQLIWFQENSLIPISFCGCLFLLLFNFTGMRFLKGIVKTAAVTVCMLLLQCAVLLTCFKYLTFLLHNSAGRVE